MNHIRFRHSNKVAAIDDDESNAEHYYEANIHDSEKTDDHHIRDLYLLDDTSALNMQQVSHETLLESLYAAITQGDTASTRAIVRRDVSILNNVCDIKFCLLYERMIVHMPDGTSNDLLRLYRPYRLAIRLYRCSMAGKFTCVMSRFSLALLLGIYCMKTKLSSLAR